MDEFEAQWTEGDRLDAAMEAVRELRESGHFIEPEATADEAATEAAHRVVALDR